MAYIMTLGLRVLPILPENLKEIIGTDNKKYDTLKGERVVPGDIKLRTWTVSSYFPANGKLAPKDYKDYYESVIRTKAPITFGLVRWEEDGSGFYEFTTEVLFDSIEWEDRMGEPGDLYFTFKLVQFKVFGSKGNA